MWKGVVFATFLVTCILIFSGSGCSRKTDCGSSGVAKCTVTEPEPPFRLVRSKLELGSFHFENSTLRGVAEQQTRLGLDLLKIHQESAGTSANVMMSPYSLSMVLSMLYAGTSGDLESAMAEALHLDAPQSNWHERMNTQSALLRTAASGYSGFELNLQNAVWLDSEVSPSSTFLDALARYYDSGVNLMDFRADPEAARARINEWIAFETIEKIPLLFGPGSITPDTVMALTNVVYLKAKWANPFPEYATRSDLFHLSVDSTKPVMMMERTAEMSYYEDADLQAVDLPYVSGGYSLAVLLPKTPKSMESTQVSEVLSRLATDSAAVHLRLPRFEFGWSGEDLLSILKGIGMPVAGYLGMNLKLSVVTQKTWIAVDEQGTEAVAATGLGGEVTSAPTTPENPKEMIVDRPFYFVIHDRFVGTPLFLGYVAAP